MRAGARRRGMDRKIVQQLLLGRGLCVSFGVSFGATLLFSFSPQQIWKKLAPGTDTIISASPFVRAHGSYVVSR